MNDWGEVLKPATLCAYCPKLCRFSCPVSESESRETVTPWSKMSLVYFASQGDNILEEASAQKAIEACTGCGACTDACAHGNPVAQTLAQTRHEIETPRVRRYREAFDAFGDVRSRPFREVHALSAKAKKGVAYFPGCARSKDGSEAVTRDLEVLSLAHGHEVALLELPEGSRCCGYPMFAEGDEERAEKAVERIEAHAKGIDLLVTADPGCVYVFKKFAKRMQVTTLVEEAAKYAEVFSEKAKGVQVRYHDPCYLGRHRGVYDAPRDLLRCATSEDAIEFAHNKSCADCSGAGGLYPVSAPEKSKAMAKKRAGESTLPVVTACPSARRNFERAGVKVIELSSLLLGKVEV